MKTITYDENEWKLVPVEPTDKMLYAAADCIDEYAAFNSAAAAYREMLAAAPQPPTAEPKP